MALYSHPVANAGGPLHLLLMADNSWYLAIDITSRLALLKAGRKARDHQDSIQNNIPLEARRLNPSLTVAAGATDMSFASGDIIVLRQRSCEDDHRPRSMITRGTPTWKARRQQEDHRFDKHIHSAPASDVGSRRVAPRWMIKTRADGTASTHHTRTDSYKAKFGQSKDDGRLTKSTLVQWPATQAVAREMEVASLWRRPLRDRQSRMRVRRAENTAGTHTARARPVYGVSRRQFIRSGAGRALGRETEDGGVAYTDSPRACLAGSARGEDRQARTVAIPHSETS
ncbi:hypothetical protein V8D89_006087 [Ganoderma adspersum]